MNATIVITMAIIILALFVPLDALAELTSQIILTVFTLVNISLVRVKLRGEPVPEGGFTVPFFIPIIGTISSLFLLAGSVVIN